MRVAHTSLTSHAPGGGRGQNIGMRGFAIFSLGASVFHKHILFSFGIRLKLLK